MKTFILGKRQMFIGMLYSYCMFIFIGIHANPSYTIHTESLTTSNGLSNNTVRHIYQDSKGFIWFSTLNGLNRYDGNTFRTFLPDSIGELPSLADGRVKSVCEDNHGFLWISTSIDRFSCYDLKRDCFVDYTGCEALKEQYAYITLLSDAVWLWGRGKGCRRVCYKNDRFYSDVFCLENGTLDTNTVSFIEQDSLGRVWIGTQEGLYVWQNKVLKKMVSSHSFVRIHCFSEYVCFITAKGEIWCIGKDEQRATKKAELPNVCSGYDLPGNAAIGNQWLIFTGDASFVFLPATGELSHAPASWNIPGAEIITDNCGNYCAYNKTGHLYYIQAKTGEVMSFRLMPEEKVQRIDKERYHVVRDSRGILWISTYGNGFYTYDLHTGHLSHFKADDTRSSVLLSDELLYMMEDRSGSIWIGADHTGVSHLKMVDKISDLFYPEPQGEDKSLYKNNVRTLASLSDGDIYMATRNGKVYLYDSTFSQKKYEKEYVSNVYSVCEDTAGVLWQGMRGGGLRVGNRLWLHHADNPASLASDDVYSLLRDRKGRMWVGTFGGGLDLALPDGKGGYIFRHFFNDSYGQKRIRMLVEDRNGWIWAATSDGVFIFRPERLLADEQAYYHYNRQNGNLRSNEIRHLLQDRNGNLWIAEAGAGFSICKPGDDYARLRFSHYGVSDGLVNDMIQAFAEDSKGNIWITTEYGVSCFDVSSKTFLNYFLSMQMLQNVYNETSALALPDGRILMGSNDGVTVVDPSRVNTDRRIPSVTFTDLRLNGVSAGSSGTERLFEKSLPYTSSVQLDYSQHSFTVYFSTLDYSAIVPPRFTYQLQGYDKGWSVPSVLPWGTYKNLPPGTYKLHVKACNSFGQWGDDYTTLEIVIVPPFWRTGWAFVIYLFLLGSLMYVAWRVVRRMDDLRNKVKVEKELTEYKLRFFTHISHEFRTPLTLIQVALDKMHQVKVIPKEMVSSVRMMDKSARRMSRLVNQLLEFRKMQEKKPVLSLEEADVIAFLHEIYLNFKEVAESKRMDFRFLPSVSSYKMFLDKEKLDKIVYNLLSNAFKYTPSGGKVDFSVQVDETIHQLVIRVVDTGVGIPKEKREQLFKHYLQNSLSGDSMGIGLYLVHELVQVHKGTVVYEECRGGGSAFIVTLPADVSVYDKKDFLIPESALLHEEELRHRLSCIGYTYAVENDGLVQGEEDGEVVFPLNRQKILIIEDDTDIREYLEAELSMYFEVKTAANGTDGLECANSYDADLIVCDVMMPDRSGFEVTQKLKADFNTSHIPVILLTAMDSPEGHLEGIESGADAYLTKPFSLKLLTLQKYE